ncbi:MAG: NUDIX hydrolase [Prevotella sp.]|uniref:NUDIX hydrolase n=1 Tax=Prevotella sp. TaxID=59823 RepID=UPI0025F405FC|nr:NUDIX domain-containing protein [Prevotella sp.]MCI7119400.1 NUDIX hydrolase [Prevotella sp.]
MEQFYNDHDRLLVSVDCIVFGFDEGELRVLMGKRKMDPGRGQWSLYGGFVGANESVNDAARRVLYALTGLKDLYMKQVGAYGDVDRDPGARVISISYYSMINVADYDQAQQQEHDVAWVNIEQLPEMYSDHRKMVLKARRMMQEKISHEPIGFNLLPELFTLSQLQQVYEAVNGEEVDKRNFRKRIKEMDFIEKTDQIDKLTSKRGAYLYRFNEKAYNEEPNFKL